MYKSSAISEVGNINRFGAEQPVDTASILFVDDEVSVAVSLRRTFRREFKSDAATSAEQALDLLAKNGPYAAIVSDMRMPGVDGIEFLSKVKALAPTTSRIMLTGHGDPETAIEAINRGQVFRFLQKPCRLDVMRSVIGEAVREHRRVTESQRMASSLLAIFKHEFRTPINRIIDYASFVAEDDATPDAINAYSRYIMRSGKTLVSMTDNLLTLNAINDGRQKLQRSLVRARSIAEQVREELRGELESRTVTLQVDIDENLGNIFVDTDLMCRALCALLSNAVKYSYADTAVKLRFAQDDHHPRALVVEILDRGIGIPPEKIDHLMQPFVQEETSSRLRFDGVGLGLPLARAIANLHGGDLFLSSEVGQGVRARFHLDRALTGDAHGLASSNAA